MRFNFIGAVIILTVYYCLYDISISNSPSNKEIKYETPFHSSLDIRKIDVGQGDDVWILTNYNYVVYKFNFLSELKHFVYYDE